MCQPKERQGGPGFQRGVEFQLWSQTQRAQGWGRVKQGKWKEKSRELEVLKQPVAGTWMMSQCKHKVGEKWIEKKMIYELLLIYSRHKYWKVDVREMAYNKCTSIRLLSSTSLMWCVTSNSKEGYWASQFLQYLIVPHYSDIKKQNFWFTAVDIENFLSIGWRPWHLSDENS